MLFILHVRKNRFGFLLKSILALSIRFGFSWFCQMSALQKMDNMPMYNILDITPAFVAKNKWTVLVQVLERHAEKEGSHNSSIPGIPFRNFIVTGMKGTKVGLVTFGRNVRQFSSCLLPYKRYQISNALLRDVKCYYQIRDYAYSWTLTSTTLVEVVEERVPAPLACTFNLTKFSDLRGHANQVQPINIRALVIRLLSIIDVTATGCTKDLVIVDEEKKPVILRIWDDLLDKSDIEPQIDTMNQHSS